MLSSSIILSHATPRQSPQAGMHFRTFFRQVHSLDPHVFLDEALQLHRITCRIKSDAGGKSVFTGFKVSPFHIITSYHSVSENIRIPQPNWCELGFRVDYH